ncbi:putative transcription factor IIIc-like protein [Aspergillus flavus]|nr:putative transcription factor IIIc-like protein [Aspergillus flavus]RAQ53791.1 putative transcription factor IIIc-like protein [Aspergillus flavus]
MPRTYGKRAKQTRLSFAPIALSQDSAEDADEKSGRKATLRYAHPSLPTIRSTRSQPNGQSSRSMSPVPFVKKSSADQQGSVSEAETSEQSTLTKKKKKKSKKNRQEQRKKKDKKEKEEKDKEKSEETADELPQHSTSETKVPVGRESESDGDEEALASARKVREAQALKRKRSQTPSDTAHSPSHNPSLSAKSSDSDAQDIITCPRRKIRRKLRRGPTQQPTIVLDDDDSDEGPISTPARKRRRAIDAQPPQTPEQNLDQDELDLREDLEDLQDSVVKETRTRGRLANSARAQRQQHLEALRRRRAGAKETNDERSGTPKSASESEGESNDDDGDETEGENTIMQPRFRQRNEDSDVESSVASNEDLDRYEDDFVLEDGTLGAPSSLPDMPFEFTRHAYKQLKDYFQDAVEWMVFNQLNPAFERSSPVYQVAFSKLEDEVKGRTGSQLISSVWNANFRNALMARPHMEVTGYPTLENHPCDACNRSGHPASSDMKLHGKAYSLETFEPLSDEASDAEEDGQERDRNGHVLPDENTRFLLGRHCKNRATMAHTLIHWRFRLNEWVVDHLKRMGYMSDKEVLRRSHWSQKKRAKKAAEAVGLMVYEGEIKKLWRDFHIDLRSARESITLG